MGVLRHTPGDLPKVERNTPKEMVSARLSSALMARVTAWGAEFHMTKTEAMERLLDRGLAFGVAHAVLPRDPTQPGKTTGGSTRSFSPGLGAPSTARIHVSAPVGPQVRKPGSMLKKVKGT